MKHEHEPILQLGGLIKCRTCGEFLNDMEEEIAIVSSYRRANRILEEIAVAGHYLAKGFEKGFVVFSREMNGNHEEITARKLSERNYCVIKRIVGAKEVE